MKRYIKASTSRKLTDDERKERAKYLALDYEQCIEIPEDIYITSDYVEISGEIGGDQVTRRYYNKDLEKVKMPTSELSMEEREEKIKKWVKENYPDYEVTDIFPHLDEGFTRAMIKKYTEFGSNGFDHDFTDEELASI